MAHLLGAVLLPAAWGLLSSSAVAQQPSSLADVLTTQNLTAFSNALSLNGIDLTKFTGVVLAPTDAAFAATGAPATKELLQYHLLRTSSLPVFNASDSYSTVGNFSEPQLIPGTPTPGWPTLLPGHNVTMTLSYPDANGVQPYWFYGYADLPATTKSSQCTPVGTGNTTNATLCVVDRVLTPMPANETIHNYLTSQPNLSNVTQLTQAVYDFAQGFSTPDVVATFFVPTNDAFGEYVMHLAARNITPRDPMTFYSVVLNLLGGHFGQSVVPHNGTGITSLGTAPPYLNSLVANGSSVTSILANGTQFGPVPLVNGTRVGKAYVYTIERVLETGALDFVLSGGNQTANATAPSPASSPTSSPASSPSPSPATSPVSSPAPSSPPGPPVPSPSPNNAAQRSAWACPPLLLLAPALLVLLL